MSNLVAQAWAQSNFASEYAARVKGVEAVNAVLTHYNDQVDALLANPEFYAFITATCEGFEEIKQERKKVGEAVNLYLTGEGPDVDTAFLYNNIDKKELQYEVELVETFNINLTTVEKVTLREVLTGAGIWRDRNINYMKEDLVELSTYVGKEKDAANLTKKINDQFSNKKGTGHSSDFGTVKSFKRENHALKLSYEFRLIAVADLLKRGFGFDVVVNLPESFKVAKKMHNIESKLSRIEKDIHWCKVPTIAPDGMAECSMWGWCEYVKDVNTSEDLSDFRNAEETEHLIPRDVLDFCTKEGHYAYIMLDDKINNVKSERLENYNFFKRFIEATKIDYKNGDSQYTCMVQELQAFQNLVEECNIDYEFATTEVLDMFKQEISEEISAAPAAEIVEVVSVEVTVIPEAVVESTEPVKPSEEPVYTPSESPIDALLDFEVYLCEKFNLDPARVLAVCNVNEYRVARNEQYRKLEEQDKHFQMLTDTVFQTGEMSEEELLALVDAAGDAHDLFFFNLINQIDACLNQSTPVVETEVKSEVVQTADESPKAQEEVREEEPVKLVDKTRVLARRSDLLNKRKSELQINAESRAA